jgi:hypothetical protein
VKRDIDVFNRFVPSLFGGYARYKGKYFPFSSRNGVRKLCGAHVDAELSAKVTRCGIKANRIA